MDPQKLAAEIEQTILDSLGEIQAVCDSVDHKIDRIMERQPLIGEAFDTAMLGMAVCDVYRKAVAQARALTRNPEQVEAVIDNLGKEDDYEHGADQGGYP